MLKAVPDQSTTEITAPLDVRLVVEEQDLRAREFICTLTVHNVGPQDVRVASVDCLLGDGLFLQADQQPAQANMREEYNEARLELSTLFNMHILRYVESYRDAFIEEYLDVLKRAASIRGALGVYGSLLTGGWKQHARAMTRNFRAMAIDITSSEDAERVIDELKPPVEEGMRQIAYFKIRRLKDIETQYPSIKGTKELASLPPGGIYERAYVIKARRRFSTISSYGIAFDVKFTWREPEASTEKDTLVERSILRSASVNVTPSPIVLSMIAVLGSAIGVLIRGVAEKGNVFLESLGVAPFAASAAIAFVIFNAIEFTQYSGKIRFLSWRTALFVGAACGLAGGHFVAAIKGFATGS